MYNINIQIAASNVSQAREVFEQAIAKALNEEVTSGDLIFGKHGGGCMFTAWKDES